MRTAPAIVAGLLLAPAMLATADERRAFTTLDECDTLARDGPDDLATYQCYWFVGRNEALLDEAAARLETLLEDDPANPRILLYLGLVIADLGRPQAEDLLRKATDGFVSEGDVRGEIYARLSVAILLRHARRSREVSEELEQALRSALRSNDPELVAQVRVNLGWEEYYQGRYGRAWKLLQEVERTVFPDAPVHLRLEAVSGLGAVSWALGRNADALEYYRREIELLGGGDPFRQAGIRRNIALVARQLAAEGRISDEELTRIYRESLDAAVQAQNRYAEPGARLMLASSLRGIEGLEEAHRGLAVARELGKVGDTCWALRLIAEKTLKLDPTRPEQALAYVEEAIQLARRRGAGEDFAHALLTRSTLRWKVGPRDQAVADSFAALDAAERIRDLQPDGEVKARVFGRFAEAYRGVARELLNGPTVPPSEEDVERAFLVMERLHARSLLDTLDAAGATQALAPTGALAQQRSGVLVEIVELHKELERSNLARAERERLLLRLAGLEEREASLRHEIAAADATYAALRGSTFPTIADVQQALRGDQALVSFLIPQWKDGSASSRPGSTWALVITPNGFRAVRLPELGNLGARMRLYLSLLERRDGSDVTGARRLYRDLLADLVDFLPETVTALIVAPDGPLHRLPFGALVDDGGAPLAERYELTIVPSAATWLRWRKAVPHPSRSSSLLALADPATRSAETARAARSADSAEVGDEPRPLPHARREVEGMLRHLGNDGRIFTGPEASEAVLKGKDVSSYGVIHLAAHAVINDEHPERSAVLLASGNPDAGEDGVLTFRETVELGLDGQVVVLSACRSASGPLIGGEGVMGLANAFFQAGARTVVAGLWPVRDRETASLVDRFGLHLGEGRSVAAALAHARRDLIRRGAPTAAWAGMVVLGDGAATPVAPRRDGSRVPVWTGVLFVIGLLAATAAVVYLRLWRRGAMPERP